MSWNGYIAVKTDAIETVVLVFCKVPNCNLIYYCTIKFDLICLASWTYYWLIRKEDLFLGAPLKAEAPSVEQQTEEGITAGLSACNCCGTVKRDRTIEVEESHRCSETKIDQLLGQIASEERVWNLLKGSSMCRIIKLSCRFGIDVLQHQKQQLPLVQGLQFSLPTLQTWTDPENQPPSLWPQVSCSYTQLCLGEIWIFFVIVTLLA